MFTPLDSSGPRVDEVKATGQGLPRFGLAAALLDEHVVVCGGQGTFDSSSSDAHGRQNSMLWRGQQGVRGRPRTRHVAMAAWRELGEHPGAMYCSATTAPGSKSALRALLRLGGHPDLDLRWTSSPSAAQLSPDDVPVAAGPGHES